MSLRDIGASFFEPPSAPVSARDTIGWWEQRRIIYNAFLVVYGVACLAVFFWGLSNSGQLQAGEDAVEPMALLAAPFAANALYTLGWLVEVPARVLRPSLSPTFGPFLLKLGVGVSCVLIACPAVFWGGYRLLQLAGFLK